MGPRGMVLVLLVAAACGGEDPTTEALVGTWINDDDGVAREIHFVDEGYAYEILVDAASVQTGTYVVADDTVVTVDGQEETRDDVLVWTVQTDASGGIAASTDGPSMLASEGSPSTHTCEPPTSAHVWWSGQLACTGSHGAPGSTRGE